MRPICLFELSILVVFTNLLCAELAFAQNCTSTGSEGWIRRQR